MSGAPSTSLFNVEWEVYPRVLYGGGTVFFKIYAWNFMPENPLNVSFTSVNTIHFRVATSDGALIKDFGAYVPEGGARYSVSNFSYTLYGVDNYTFILTADWGSESHTRTVMVEVKPTGNIIASMDCNPAVVPLDGSTTCTVHFELKSAEAVTLNLEEVDFGGKRVWPNGPSSVTVNKQTVTLTPTNMQEDLTITIDINDELANHYFGERPWDPVDRYVFRETFKDRFAGYTYLVKAKFSSGITVSDVFEVAVSFEGFSSFLLIAVSPVLLLSLAVLVSNRDIIRRTNSWEGVAKIGRLYCQRIIWRLYLPST